MAGGSFGQQFQGGVVQDFCAPFVLVNDAAMSVRHVFAQAHIGDDQQVGQFLLQQTDGLLDDAVRGISAGRLVVRTTASPVDDKANIAVCKQVADYLGVPVRRVTIKSGHRSRDKVLQIDP